MSIGKVEWTESGSGAQTVLLVHGAHSDKRSWSEQIPELAKHYRTIALNLPGHGDSDPPPGGVLSLNAFVQAVETVRARAGAERLVLFGHSMGAGVVARYAQLFPQHVAGLVFVDGLIMAPEIKALFKERVKNGDGGVESIVRGMFSPATLPDLQQRILAMMRECPEETSKNIINVVTEPDVGADPQVEVPALAILADHRSMPPEFFELSYARTQATCRDLRRETMANTGHFLMMERPDEFNRIVVQFISQTCAPAV